MAASEAQITTVPDARTRFRAGVRSGIVIGILTFTLAVTFGVLARSLGWGLIAPVVFSVVAFSGSAQFAVASVLSGGGGAVAAILAAVLVNARFLPMGVAVAPALKGGRVRRALEGQTVVDASWALAIRGDGRIDREFMMGATLPQFVGWFAGTAVGVALSGAIGDVRVVGFDAIFPAFFLALLVGEARRSRSAVATALLATAVALVLLPVAPAGVPVIAASGVALLGLVRS